MTYKKWQDALIDAWVTIEQQSEYSITRSSNGHMRLDRLNIASIIAQKLGKSANKLEKQFGLDLKNGIDPNRILYYGHGENDPIESNATEKGRQRNRRVEVFMKLLKT